MFGKEEALKTAHRGVGRAVVCRATRKDCWTVRLLLAPPTTSRSRTTVMNSRSRPQRRTRRMRPDSSLLVRKSMISLMPLDGSQLDAFDRDGYLFFPRMFSAEEIKVLTDEVPNLRLERGPWSSVTRMVSTSPRPQLAYRRGYRKPYRPDRRTSAAASKGAGPVPLHGSESLRVPHLARLQGGGRPMIAAIYNAGPRRSFITPLSASNRSGWVAMSPSRCRPWAANPGCRGEDSTARSPRRRARRP
jgi:hypothetical protein